MEIQRIKSLSWFSITLEFTPMKIVDSLLNRSEEVVFRELQSISQDNNLKVFAKPRLSDVILKGREFLTQREFDFYTRSHCDFVVTDIAYRPLMIIEYDGPLHAHEKQQERDRIKDDLSPFLPVSLLPCS
jgi:hypothetical protein